MRDKIVVIGSSNVDLIMKMARLPEKGETVTDAEFMQTFGGKGANQAVGAARTGGKVIFVNCVGEDAYTPIMVDNYEKDGIDTRFVFRETGIPSGHALVMIGDEGNNYLSVAPGANYRLTPGMIDKASDALDEAAMIVLQYEIMADTIKYVIDMAAERDIPVMWNFAPAREFDTNYLNKVAVLVVNEVEADFLSGRKVSSPEDAKEAARSLREKGPEVVVLTLGEKGAFVIRQDGEESVPAFKVSTIDTTAAGDVFCGSLAVALVEKKPMRKALVFASAAAALAVTRLGAQPSAPTRAEVERFIKNGGI